MRHQKVRLKKRERERVNYAYLMKKKNRSWTLLGANDSF
jgi:hypothetical protein